MIVASGLFKRFGAGESQVTALKDVSLKVENSQRVSIIGRSGSGKSTLLNLLAGLDRPTSGKLEVCGLDFESASRREMAQYRVETVGVIFQAFNLIPQRTAFQNVELPLIIAGVKIRERKHRVNELLQRVGLTNRGSHLPSQLSGGEQQRVAIARALANRPQIILADEPTGNLDSKTSREISELILNQCSESSTTFLLVTHDRELADSMAERVLTMTDGELFESEDLAAATSEETK